MPGMMIERRIGTQAPVLTLPCHPRIQAAEKQINAACERVVESRHDAVNLAHPQSRYFAVGRIGRDQVADYAARKGMSLAEAERWLGPNLAYEPEPEAKAAAR